MWNKNTTIIKTKRQSLQPQTTIKSHSGSWLKEGTTLHTYDTTQVTNDSPLHPSLSLLRKRYDKGNDRQRQSPSLVHHTRTGTRGLNRGRGRGMRPRWQRRGGGGWSRSGHGRRGGCEGCRRLTFEGPDVDLLSVEAVVVEAADEVEVGRLHQRELVQTGLVDTDRSIGAAAAEVIQGHQQHILSLHLILKHYIIKQEQK